MSSKSDKWKNLGRDLKQGSQQFIDQNQLNPFNDKTLDIQESNKIKSIVETNYNIRLPGSKSEFQDINEFIKFLIKTTKQKLIKYKKPNELLSPAHEKTPTLEFQVISFKDFSSRVKKFSNYFDFSKEQPENFLEFMQKCKIQVQANEVKHLKKLLKAAKDLENIENVLKVLVDWYNSYHSKDLRAKLMSTINDYEKLKLENCSIDERISIDNLIHSLKSQMNKIPNKSNANYEISENIVEKSQIGLSEIFRHYSKQQFLIGKNPTFENISKNLQILTLAKFLKFCKDFQIIQVNSTERDARKRSKWPKLLFKKFSDFNRDMHEHQFIASMELIADHYLDSDYDKRNNTDWASCTSQVKTCKFFEIMGFSDPAIYSKKLGEIAAHFGVENYSRIPENDPSKKYKYDPEKYRKLKMSVDEWKVRKMENSKQLEDPSQRLIRKQSEHIFSTLTSKPTKLKKPLGASLKPSEKKTFTFRELQDLKLEDLQSLNLDQDLNSLIVPAEDEHLSRYLSRNPIVKSSSEQVLQAPHKFPAIIKNSDNQLSKLMNYSKKRNN